jgi:hypothetical protein
MKREFSNLFDKYHNVQDLLDTLTSKKAKPDAYKKAMFEIGLNLGNALLDQINSDQASVYLACTVEDADFLARGILQSLEGKIRKVFFACFWNQHFSPFEIEDLKVAPILKRYQEPASENINYLIVVKSIISGACVVRTNLVHLIQSIEPEKIFIVAPVIHAEAEQKLKNEFEEAVYSKFQFFYFAKDQERTSTGEIRPGIGGNVYQRLGFEDQDSKNKYIPDIVKKRRAELVSKSGN